MERQHSQHRIQLPGEPVCRLNHSLVQGIQYASSVGPYRSDRYFACKIRANICWYLKYI